MKVSSPSFSRILIVATSAALLAACGSSDGGGGQAQTGFLKVGITDAPVDMAAAVVVTANHYVIDPVAGMVVVLFAFWVVTRRLGTSHG